MTHNGTADRAVGSLLVSWLVEQSNNDPDLGVAGGSVGDTLWLGTIAWATDG